MGCRSAPKFIDSVTHFSICRKAQRFADDHSLLEPPDPFPNSEVKRQCADGSVVRPCESRSSSAFYPKPPLGEWGFFIDSVFA